MNYASSAFGAFFVATFIAYYAVRSSNAQILILIGSSLFFYAWESPSLTLLFAISWLISASSAYCIQRTKDNRARKKIAVWGVVLNLSILCFFKYKGLIWDSVLAVDTEHVSIFHMLLSLPLPIGISFYTFHGISLVVDVYTRRFDSKIFLGEEASASFRNTLLYLVFFPQLVAGPIIKAKDFFPQLKYKRHEEINYLSAFRTLVLGYFLKVYIADNLAEQTSSISYPYFLWRSSGELVVLLIGYSAQIFSDFGGYSLIATGLAELLGYKLPQNFRFPYLSVSLADFWRRWHISLSSWLRDYVYIPLGGSRAHPVKIYFNLLVVMFLGGLWHGAAWSFAIWGLWHGLGLMLERKFRESHQISLAPNNFIFRTLRIIVVFAFVTLGWLLFRLQEFEYAEMYFVRMIGLQGDFTANTNVLMIIFYSMFVFFYHIHSFVKTSMTFRDTCRAFMLVLIITGGGPNAPFIYFQF